MINNRGYIALISVLSISAVGLAIASALLILGIDSTKTSINTYQGFEAKILAHTCSDLALDQIRANITYTGTSTQNLGNGSCTYIVTNTGGSNREVLSSGAVNNIIRREKVLINQVSPTIGISSWLEVAIF
ncbi:hypothetical protein HGB13_01880 [bacterium]|nr:hypothetical protein [bacterium]